MLNIVCMLLLASRYVSSKFGFKRDYECTLVLQWQLDHQEIILYKLIHGCL